MKKLIKKVSAFIARARDGANRMIIRAVVCRPRMKRILASNSGEGYIDTAIKILIAVVLGALLLAGLYALFGDVVMPTLKQRIQEMFNYAG
jgi:hypothetical protein